MVVLNSEYNAIFLNPFAVFLRLRSDFDPSTRSGRLLSTIRSSATWEESEVYDVPGAYSKIATEIGGSATPPKVRDFLRDARNSATLDKDLLQSLKEVKEKARGNLRLFIVGDINQTEWTYYLNRPDLEPMWDLFDDAFPSFKLGMRVTDPMFMGYLVRCAEVDPKTSIFLDNKAPRVMAAKLYGMTGFVFKDGSDAVARMRNLVQDPVKRGWDFLYRNAKNTPHSVTDAGIQVHDNLSQLLVLEATGRDDLVTLSHERTSDPWSFFEEGMHSPFDTNDQDVDVTVLAVLLWLPAIFSSHVVMQMILWTLNAIGTVRMVWYGPDSHRIDPVVCANVLRLFYRHRRQENIQPTFQWVVEVLTHYAYLDGTHRYKQPDLFLYYLTSLVTDNSHFEEIILLREILIEHIKERMGNAEDALGISLNILSCKMLGIENTKDLARLRNLQCLDGGWEASYICTYGSPSISWKNRQVTTAFAVKALEADTRKIRSHIEGPEENTSMMEHVAHTSDSENAHEPTSPPSRFGWLQYYNPLPRITAIGSSIVRGVSSLAYAVTHPSETFQRCKTAITSRIAEIRLHTRRQLDRGVRAVGVLAEPHIARAARMTFPIYLAVCVGIRLVCGIPELPAKAEDAFRRSVVTPVGEAAAPYIDSFGASLMRAGGGMRTAATTLKAKQNNVGRVADGDEPEMQEVL